jgi:hypothetical protein
LYQDLDLAGLFAVAVQYQTVAFDTGYAGSNGTEPQKWINGNGTSVSGWANIHVMHH